MISQILLLGSIIGIIHFIIVGVLYQNPFVAKIYTKYKDHPGVKNWNSPKKYLLLMFLGTQIEIFILTAAYILLRNYFTSPTDWSTALILGTLFSLIRVYPRFWNMWIQTSYPRTLLYIEIINGTIGTFIIIIGLKLLSI